MIRIDLTNNHVLSAELPFKPEDALIVLSVSGQGVQGDLDVSHIVAVTFDKKVFIRDNEGIWEEATSRDLKELFEYTMLFQGFAKLMGW